MGAAGVSLDGAGVKGVKAMPFSEVKSTFPTLKNPANRHRGVSLTPKEFHYSFTNTLTEEESQAAYDRYAAPTPGRILFQGGFANFDHDAATTYDFSDDDRAPLLFVSGGSDHILPVAVQRENYKRNAKHSTAIAAHKVSRDGITTPAVKPDGKPSLTSPLNGRSTLSRGNSMRPLPRQSYRDTD